MDPYELVLLGAGAAVLLAAWLPSRLAARPLSLPIVLVAIGVGLFALPLGFTPDHRVHGEWFERATEFGVIVSLMGAGLKLDRPIGWRTWQATWRLLLIGMPATILVVTIFGRVAGLSLGAALLVGAALAPTDPVLAADVQVGEPSTGSPDAVWAEDEVRFSLTSEAGLNDGLAFPFVYAAIALAASANGPSVAGVAHWVAVDLLFRLAVGLLSGLATGWALSRLLFGRKDGPEGLAAATTGFVALAATLLSYGIAELLHGYGFLAVFVTAVTIRSAERSHRYHKVLHDFADEVEQLLVVALLVLLGGALVGGVLDGLDLAGALVALGCIFVARPLACRIALHRMPILPLERRTIAFFGIRGVGSFYYLAYAATSAQFPGIDRVWAIVAFTVVISIVVHGVAATPVMHRLDRLGRRRRRRPAAHGSTAGESTAGESTAGGSTAGGSTAGGSTVWTSSPPE